MARDCHQIRGLGPYLPPSRPFSGPKGLSEVASETSNFGVRYYTSRPKASTFRGAWYMSSTGIIGGPATVDADADRCLKVETILIAYYSLCTLFNLSEA